MQLIANILHFQVFSINTNIKLAKPEYSERILLIENKELSEQSMHIMISSELKQS